MPEPVVEPITDLVVDTPVWSALDAPFRDVATAVSDPVPCGADCVTVELRVVALTA